MLPGDRCSGVNRSISLFVCCLVVLARESVCVRVWGSCLRL